MEQLKSNFKNIAFARPSLIRNEEGKSRTASALELFVDLIYVVAFGNITHVFIDHPSYDTFIQTIFMFVTIFVMWQSLVFYNQRFEMNNLYHRFMMVISMIPVALLASVNTFDNQFKLQLVLFGFVSSRLFVALLWQLAGKNKEGNGEYYETMRLQVNYMTVVYGISAILGALVFVFQGLQLPLWGGALVLEFFAPVIIWKFFMPKDATLPALDHHLRGERYLLFTILMIGEGLVLMKTGLAEMMHFEAEQMAANIIFFFIVAIFFWFYLDFYSKYGMKKRSNIWSQTFFIHSITMYLLIVLLGTVVHDVNTHHHIAKETALLIPLVGTVYYINHMLFQNFKEFDMHEEYGIVNFDIRITSIISIALLWLTYFIHMEGLPLLIALFVIFSINIGRLTFDWLSSAKQLYTHV